ncbi:hypothetical protein LSAT2_020328, partial [Lamellibrachia satsuma]
MNNDGAIITSRQHAGKWLQNVTSMSSLSQDRIVFLCMLDDPLVTLTVI